MYNLKKFLKENELKLGQGYDIKPAAKFAVLGEALKNYYQTFQSGWGSDFKLCHFIILNNTDVQLNSANGHNYIMNCYNSIIHFQMFLELYITDFLEEIHPVLIKGKLNKEIDLINAILWNYNVNDFANKNTIPFSEVVKRLELLIKNDDKLPEEIKVKKQYHFFCSHIETINQILDLRNNMLHNGKGIPKDFALDLLWVNHIIPLISDILSIEERIIFLDRNTHCRLNVLKELEAIELDSNYQDINKKDDFIKTLNYICHLKELGRASFHNKYFMGEWGDEKTYEIMHQGYEGRKIQNVIQEAIALKNTGIYYEIYNCPCCGLQTLLNYYPCDILAVNKTRLQKAKCINCTYQINSYIGEPKDFNIMNENVFVYID